jgi:DNA-binding GntR family transcriptional regulator
MAAGVVVGLTEAGLARLSEAVPVHLDGVSRLFIERLDDEELAALEQALDKVSCTAHSADAIVGAT